MEFRQLSVPGAWEITPKQFGDPRGVFLEWFKGAPFAEEAGHALALAQANLSVSAAGVPHLVPVTFAVLQARPVLTNPFD